MSNYAFRCCLVSLILFLFAFTIMRMNGAYGASRDDSIGYILAAERIATGKYGKPDWAYGIATDILGEYKAQTFLPSHHVPSSSTRVVSKYSLGLPLILGTFRLIFGHFGYSLVAPFMAALGIVGVFNLGLQIFREHKHKFWISILASIFLFISPLYFIMGRIHPMTEVGVVACCTSGSAFFISGVTNRSWRLLSIAGLVFGIMVTIRIPSILLILPCVTFLSYTVLKNAQLTSIRSIIGKVSGLELPITAFTSCFVLATLPVFLQNFLFSGNPATSTQAGHVSSLSWDHLFANKGTNVVGNIGGLERNLRVLDDNIVLGLAFLLLGIGFLIYRHRDIFSFSVIWILPTYLLYSAWLNPYPRYLIPCLPIMLIVCSYALCRTIDWSFKKHRLRIFAVVLCIWAVVGLGPKMLFFLDEIHSTTFQGRDLGLRTPILRKSDSISITAIRKFVSPESLIIFDGNNPETRGIIETYTGIRTVSPRQYNTNDGSYGDRLDADDFGRVIDIMKSSGKLIYHLGQVTLPEKAVSCERCQKEPIYEFTLSFVEGVHRIHEIR